MACKFNFKKSSWFQVLTDFLVDEACLLSNKQTKKKKSREKSWSNAELKEEKIHALPRSQITAARCEGCVKWQIPVQCTGRIEILLWNHHSDVLFAGIFCLGEPRKTSPHLQIQKRNEPKRNSIILLYATPSSFFSFFLAITYSLTISHIHWLLEYLSILEKFV